MDQNTYTKVVGFVIDNLEGGYYHPQMLVDGRVKDQRYSNSGETMFGIDRKAGGAINDTTAGKQFWSLIDNANAKNTWKWNYKGGQLGDQLKKLAADIIYPEYDSFSKKYLSPKAKQLVESDDRLLFNFVYASWNGAGWFKKFADKFNAAVAAGVTNLDELTKVAVAARTESSNSLIAQGGNKIANIIDQLKTEATAIIANPIGEAKKKPALVIAGVVMITSTLVLTIWFASKLFSKKNNQ